MEKYKEPKYEIKRIWQCRERRVNSIGIGVLGMVSAGMPENQSEFPFKTKFVFLGTARIQRKVFET